MAQLFRAPVAVRPVVKLTKWGVRAAVRRRKNSRRSATGIPLDQQAALIALARSTGQLNITGIPVAEERPSVFRRMYVKCGGDRALRRPLVVSGGLFVTWTAWHFLPPLGFWGFVTRGVVFAGAAAAGAVWCGRVREGVRRVAAIAVVGVGGLWLLTPAGPVDFPGRWVVYGAVTVVATAARGWHFRIRAKGESADPAPAQAGQARVWDELLGCERGPIAGTWLEDVEVAEDGKSWTALVRSPRGGAGTASVRGKVDNIASAFGVSPLWVEVRATDDNAISRVVVTTEATLTESRAWTPDGVTETTVEVATRPDGSRVIAETHSPANGVRHAWFSGGSGAGKTTALVGFVGRLMRPHLPTLAETGKEVGWVVLDMVDLGETSLPCLVPKAFRSGDTVEDAHLALDRALAVMQARQAAMKRMTFVDRDGVERTGVSTLRVGPTHPIYALLVEEAGSLVHDTQAMAKVAELARLGRKYGVMIIWVTQGTSLDEAWGTEQARMNVMKNGTTFSGATSNNAGSLVFNGSKKIDMSAIPDGMPGVGVWLTRGDDRLTIARTDWIDDDDNRPEHVPSTWQVADMIVPGVLEDSALTAVAAVEDAAREEAEAAIRAAEDKANVRRLLDVPVDASTRDVVRRVVDELSSDCEGGPRPVKLAAIVARFTEIAGVDSSPTSKEWKRAYDTVRKALPGVAVKTDRGEWTAA